MCPQKLGMRNDATHSTNSALRADFNINDILEGVPTLLSDNLLEPPQIIPFNSNKSCDVNMIITESSSYSWDIKYIDTQITNIHSSNTLDGQIINELFVFYNHIHTTQISIRTRHSLQFAIES